MATLMKGWPVLVGLAAFVVLASRGSGLGIAAAADQLAVLTAWVPGASWPVALGGVLFVLGGCGIGGLLWPRIAGVTTGDAGARAIAAALGVALLLFLSLLLGWVGAFGGFGVTGLGRLIAPLPIIAGFFGLRAWWAIGTTRESLPDLGERVDRRAGLIVLGIAGGVLALAAVQAPGVLWDSEFGGYDTLSYHLQLPDEWLSLGRAVPLEHNVYSFLPGAIEHAYYQMAVVLGASFPMAGSLGDGVAFAHGIHATLTLFAAWQIMALCRVLAERAGASFNDARITGVLCGALVLATPWVLVVGSMAYNEMAVVGLGAAALHAAISTRLRDYLRWLLAGWLVGIACLCKPTALILLGPTVGAALLFADRPATATVARGLAIGCVGGLVALSPWLIRNTVESGNPMFPYATGVFGTAHWDTEQAARWADGHRFDGNVADRLRLTVLPDASDPAGSRHRGLMHAQWFAWWPVVLVGLIASLIAAHTRRLGAVLAAGLGIGLLAWLLLTHIQSRFLIPLVVPGVVLLALASTVHARAVWVLVAAGALQASASVAQFLAQRDGSPVLPGGSNLFTGRAAGRDAEEAERMARANPVALVNLALPRDARVMLIGEAIPFYYLRPTVYATTWDRPPIVDAIESRPGDPGAWTNAARSLGVTHALINFSELTRLERSGWNDPALTLDTERPSMQAWVEHPSTEIVATWPERGVVILRMLESEAPSP
ncbi:MAG: hypothetical protein AAGG07_00040 [Planctomycetota bacterium]